MAAAALLLPAASWAGTPDQSQTDISGSPVLVAGPDAVSGLSNAAQTFTAGAGGVLDEIDLYLGDDDGTATGPLTVTVTSTAPGAATTTVLATATIPGATVPQAPAWVPVALTRAAPAPSEDGTQYTVTMEASGSDHYEWYASGSDAYAGGESWTRNGSASSAWNRDPSRDMAFRTSVNRGTLVRFTEHGCSTWTLPVGATGLGHTGIRAWAIGAAGQPAGLGGGLGGTGDGLVATLADLAGGDSVRVCVDTGGGAPGAPFGGSPSAGGGGASGLSLGSDFGAPLLVAAGGGGAGTNPLSPLSGGSAGSPAAADVGGSGGGGGTQSAGGFPGAPGNGTAGRGTDAQGPGAGGAGADDGGGGGGAGFYGGGGGGGLSGGGGGSDFCGPVATVHGCARLARAGTSTVAGAGPGDAQVDVLYTIAGPPSSEIFTPAPGAVFLQGQAVPTAFGCLDGHDGPGVVSCRDAAGRESGSLLDTSTLGTHTLTVTATSRDGLKTTGAPVSYRVIAPPPVGVTPPATTGGGATTTGSSGTRHRSPRVRITRFHQSHKRWRERGEHVAKKERKRPVGTAFSFRLNTAAKVTLTFTTKQSGRKVKRHCAHKTHKNRHARHCTRTVTVVTLHRHGRRGANKVRFGGKLRHGHKLRPGTYKIRITAKAHGHKATSRRLSFRVV